VKWNQFLSAIFLSFLLFLSNPFDLAKAEGDLNVEVEIETGPVFEPGDEAKIQGCIDSTLSNRFLFGTLGTIPDGGAVCPQIKFFDDTHTFCWLVDVWHAIEPGVVIYWMIQVIIHL
jgi:hypothetical protein